METIIINVSPSYIEQLVFFYGAERPRKIKDDFITFIKNSSLNELLDIEEDEELIITLKPEIDELFEDKIINPEWKIEKEKYNKSIENLKIINIKQRRNKHSEVRKI